MSAARVAKLEALLARVIDRRGQPRLHAVASEPAVLLAPVHTAATTPPPPPVAVPEVSIPRQPLPSDELQETSHVARVSGPELIPSAAQSHARIATAARGNVNEEPELEEHAPVSSARTIDPSIEADTDSQRAPAPPESTRQLATNPPTALASPESGPVASVPPRAPTVPPVSADLRAPTVPPVSAAPFESVPPGPATSPAPSVAPAASVAPESIAPRSGPVVTRGTLPPTAEQMIEFEGEPPSLQARTVGDLLDATFSL